MALTIAEREHRAIAAILSKHGFSDTDDVPLSAVADSALTTLRHEIELLSAALAAVQQETTEKFLNRDAQGICVKCGLVVRRFDGIISDERGMLHLSCSLLLRLEAVQRETQEACAQIVDDFKQATDCRYNYNAARHVDKTELAKAIRALSAPKAPRPEATRAASSQQEDL